MANVEHTDISELPGLHLYRLKPNTQRVILTQRQSTIPRGSFRVEKEDNDSESFDLILERDGEGEGVYFTVVSRAEGDTLSIAHQFGGKEKKIRFNCPLYVSGGATFHDANVRNITENFTWIDHLKVVDDVYHMSPATFNGLTTGRFIGTRNGKGFQAPVVLPGDFDLLEDGIALLIDKEMGSVFCYDAFMMRNRGDNEDIPVYRKRTVDDDLLKMMGLSYSDLGNDLWRSLHDSYKNLATFDVGEEITLRNIAKEQVCVQDRGDKVRFLYRNGEDTVFSINGPSKYFSNPNRYQPKDGRVIVLSNPVSRYSSNNEKGRSHSPVKIVQGAQSLCDQIVKNAYRLRHRVNIIDPYTASINVSPDGVLEPGLGLLQKVLGRQSDCGAIYPGFSSNLPAFSL